MKLEKGFVQVYTGNGKGKTTAALGLALRGAGAGMKIFIAQFVKGMKYSELDALKRLEPEIVIHQYGRGCFIMGKPVAEDYTAAEQGLSESRKALVSGDYDMVILDEIHIALHFGLVSREDVLKMMENRPRNVELVLTGRYAPEEIMEKADLVTEMKEIRHYYEKGTPARTGIEK